MERDAVADLTAWARTPDHPPLVIRGARQVGKTWLIEAFGRTELGAVATLDFERHPAAAGVFGDPSAQANLRAIEALLGKPIMAGRCLLFLDEV